MTGASTRQPHDINGLWRVGSICLTGATVAWICFVGTERAAADLIELVFPSAHHIYPRWLVWLHQEPSG